MRPGGRTAALVAGAAAGGALVHLVPASVAWRQARCQLLPGLSGVGRPDHVALTFDDGPDRKATPALLDALDELGWQATFFCLGSQVADQPELIPELVTRGHEIGVHGDEHRSHLRRFPWEVVDDLRRARSRIEDLTGQPVEWFRPPYGAVSAGSVLAARRSGLRMVLWTTWGRDWRPGLTGADVVACVERTFRPGATVLLHDSDVTSAPLSWRATLDALPLLADRWDARGLKVGTLGDHF